MLLLAALAVACPALLIADRLDDLDPDENRAQVATILEQGGYQTELPLREPETSPPNLGSGVPFLSGFARVMFWTVVAVVCALVLTVIVNWALGRFGGRHREAAAAPVMSATLSDAPLADAEALAREGRFAEAIHVLLLCTIQELREGLEYAAPPALTSREIQVGAPLDRDARGALGALVDEVEISHFGGRPVGEPQYRRCVTHFQELLRACGAAS